MLKFLQARLQQYVNRELPDIQADLEKSEEPDMQMTPPLWQKVKRN